MKVMAKARIEEARKSLEGLLEDLLEKTRQSIPLDHRNEFDGQISVLRLRQVVNSIEDLYLVINSIGDLCKQIRFWMGEESSGLVQEWRNLRNDLDHIKREIQLLEPSTSEEFDAGLMWLATQGQLSNVSLVQTILA